MASQLQITETLSGDIRILELQGKLDTFSADELESTISKSIAAGATKLLFDLAGLIYISSAGLRVFMWTAKQLDKSKGRIVLCSMRPEVKEIFDISGFTALFEILPGREGSLSRF